MTRGIWFEYFTATGGQSGTVTGEHNQPKPLSDSAKAQKWFPEGTDINGKKIDVNTGELIPDDSL